MDMVKARGTEQKREMLPAGLHPAVCIGVIDFGQQETTYQDSTRLVYQVGLVFELPGVTINIDGEDRPRVISRIFTNSLNQKSNLHKFLVSWRTKGFSDEELKGYDLNTLLGQTANLNIIHDTWHDGSVHEKIDGAFQCPGEVKRFHPDWYFSFDDGFDIPEILPQWIKDRIKKSQEWIEHEFDQEPGKPVQTEEEQGEVPF